GVRIVDVLSKELGINPGQTTKDLQFTIEAVNCLGCCAIGPTVVLNGEYYGQMTPQKTLNQIKRLIKKGK
ncbi:MAG: NAD(P)H-dependent oxidoreductase subunit E, partial [Clostridia bacterium]|nr:NAD(P)H-dependent oxidoreductase subunit E [Clostridia bacterium]